MHILWYMCKYTPLELAAGFGAEVRRLESVGDSTDTADALAHPNICGYGKALLEACSRPEVEEVVLVNCCDVARRIYDILEAQGTLKFVFLMDLPHRNGQAQRWMLEQELRRFLKAYGAYTGREFDLPAAWRALRAQTENGQKPNLAEQASSGHWISLQGAHGGLGLMELVSRHMPVPVRDDTCSGNRSLAGISSEDFVRNAAGAEASGILKEQIPQMDLQEFLYHYAQRLLGQVPCMRMEHAAERGTLGAEADGVIYHTMKFCDYYGFEYAERQKSEQPHLKIETDASRQSAGQLATRLDAFAEQLYTGKIGRTAGTLKETGMQNKRFTAGIDSGSTSTDVVILDEQRQIVASTILRTGAGAARGAERALAETLEQAQCSREDLAGVIATGYGRDTIGIGDSAVTEITCHARGAHYLNPETRTIIDIGGQDSKVICIDEDGAVQNFTMNDKCAAGTGRFLEMMARTLELSMEEMEQLGLAWKQDVTISNMCTVFAESEVVSLIAQNTPESDIIHGLNKSVAAKTAALVKRLGGTGPYMMTGGVAKNQGLVRELEKRLDAPVYVSEHAQLCGAIGAALIAFDAL